MTSAPIVRLVQDEGAWFEQGDRVSLQRTPAGTTNVRIEYYEPLEWDATLDTEEREFADLDTALGWLDLVQGVHWSQLHEPSS